MTKMNAWSRGARLMGVVLMFCCAVRGAEAQRELLWPDVAPEAKGNDPAKDMPAITIYVPEKANGTAVVICPGGGYGNLAMGHEGKDIAEWLNSMGITAVVLEYRMSRGGYQHPVPLMDAQRAIRTVRHRAEKLNLDPSRIGILGFSAGGHLASTAGTHFDQGDSSAEDPIDRVSCRPDFMILCYPVIAFGESYTHLGSQFNLIGKDASAELIESLSNEKQVTKETPPTFLFHTDEDTTVPSENSLMFYAALRKAGVPAELHIYRKGAHGLGLASGVEGTSEWPEACRQWLSVQGFLKRSE
ncbi:MAG: alpha/beta hydrolase [Pontiellaceae bacterium]|nr:alpha/beta hydrolase [Pontiellaceae bacterium]